ncbi:MAG: BatA domain-containing protein, partial [Candidatus Marinimicrobia bacterium]|nr:BatA domain-containing protein [Candidatus Neomarinimicrobiota bacterium]
MITFENPWILLGLISIPILILWQRSVQQRSEGSFRISAAALISHDMKRRGRFKMRLLHTLQYITVALIIMGLSRPRLRDSLQETKVDVVDIVLVMDISSSMLATDFQPNRLEAVKKTAKDFIHARSGDRMGVLVFAGE